MIFDSSALPVIMAVSDLIMSADMHKASSLHANLRTLDSN